MSYVTQLEQEFAARVGAKYAIAMNSGTATLHATLLAMGVDKGDEVIVPGLGPIMTSAAVIQARAKPVFCDVEPLTFTMDSRASLTKLIGPNTKAVISVSLYGLPSRLDEIQAICNDHNLFHIIDNAQSVLSTFRGNPVGNYALATSYSFESSKHINVGEGGIVTVNNEYLARKIRQYGNHGFRCLTKHPPKSELQQLGYERHDLIGWNYRMPELVAENALEQVKVLKEIVQRRIDAAIIIRQVLREYPYFSLQAEPNDRTNSYWCVAATYHPGASDMTWSKFYKRVVELGGEGFYSAWLPPYQEQAINSIGDCPGAEFLSTHLMQFPNNYTTGEAKRQAYILRKVCEEIHHNGK